MTDNEEVVFHKVKSLLNSKARGGVRPAAFFSTSRSRSYGKTTDITKEILGWTLGTVKPPEQFDHWNKDSLFMLLVRLKDETGATAEGMFASCLSIYHPEGWFLSEVRRGGGFYSEVYLNEPVINYDAEVEEDELAKPKYIQTLVGYVAAVKYADRIKKVSNRFSRVDVIFFDEFQPKDRSTIIPGEFDKFLDLYQSIARAPGRPVRYIPVIFASNQMTVADPYLIHFGISQDIRDGAKKVRSARAVLEILTNPVIDKLHADSEIMQGVQGTTVQAAKGAWIHDSNVGIGKPKNWGPSRYVGTVVADNVSYGIRIYPETDFLYISKNYDADSPHIFRAERDGDPTFTLLKASDMGRVVKRYAQGNNMRYQDKSTQLMVFEHLL